MLELKSLWILFLLIFLETIFLSLLFLGVLQHRIYAFFESKIIHKRQEAITDHILPLLEHPDTFSPHPVFAHTNLLLDALEAFNHRVRGAEWKQVKEKIASHYLLHKARRWSTSWFWKKRSRAARIFALQPLAQDEPLILKLLTDPVFLVQSVASLAAVQLESKKGVELSLHWMARTSQNYTRFYYRDILLQGSAKVFQYLAEISQGQKNPQIKLASLEVFAGKTVPVPLPFLKEDLASQDPQILSTALRVLIRNPTENTEEILLQASHNSAPIVRTVAALGLKTFAQPNILQALESMLKDPVWEVKLQAATSLSEMGSEGIEILKKRNEAEIARYALDFLV